MDNDAIKKILDSSAGIVLREYLISRLNELKNIDSIHEKDVASHQVIELKAQKRAYEKLKQIFQDIMTFSEITKSKDPRDSFVVGLEEE